LLVEDYDISDQSGRSRLLMPGIEWSRLRADNSLRPRKGSKIAFEVRAAADSLGSDTSFLQTVSEGKWVWSLMSTSRILVRSQLGMTSEEVFSRLPPSVRFFAGGDNSVRGYGFETLGEVEDGDVIGGRKLLVGSIELDKLVRPDWSVALFVDSGSAFNDTANFSTGVGIGVRWYSPLGPIRLDLAHPLDDSRSVRVHVSLGPDV
jgi:translocation and assembly module TamA